MNKAKKLCGIMMLIFILTFANTAFCKSKCLYLWGTLQLGKHELYRVVYDW